MRNVTTRSEAIPASVISDSMEMVQFVSKACVTMTTALLIKAVKHQVVFVTVKLDLNAIVPVIVSTLTNVQLDK